MITQTALEQKWRGHFPLYKIWIQPHIFNIKQYIIAKFERHLFPSMSLMSGNTFPWSCFSLTTGSNDRFSRISFLSWNNLGYFLHFKPSSLFRCSCSCSCYWASFQPLARPLDVLRANRRPWQTREGTLQRGFIFNALFPVGGWLPCQGKEGYWVKHHLMKLLVHGRIIRSKIILYGTKIVPPKDTCPTEVHTEVGWWPCQWFHQGTWTLCTLVRRTLLLGAQLSCGERIIVCTWCVLEEEPTERCEGSTKDRWPLHKDPTDHQVVDSDHDGHEMT